ncbi:phosphatidate cytidylyltransferase 5, chloroplastic-like, partial [Hibiscus syriacus]|uniref:phosphatidate cytidylyltransferase 5, chloroplastic-like n=1 Tax=Hibiscus syriacus TaxID=106335 RepID=UPI00192124B9
LCLGSYIDRNENETCRIDISVTSAAFVVAMALLMQRGNPRFAQLSSTMFGLFYCGYLPCFWVKLRCGFAAPSLNTRIGAGCPYLLGAQVHWTVGLVATLISFISIITADTYAFLGGKAIGRRPLTNMSPKKTWEGATAGLGGCIATSVVLSKILSWPASLLRFSIYLTNLRREKVGIILSNFSSFRPPWTVAGGGHRRRCTTIGRVRHNWLEEERGENGDNFSLSKMKREKEKREMKG